jgi:putative transposase
LTRRAKPVRLFVQPKLRSLAPLRGKDDRLVRVAPMLEQVGDWHEFPAEGLSIEEAEELRRHERSGRPLGSEGFVARLEGMPGRLLRPQKPGPKCPRRRGKRASAKSQVWCFPKYRSELKEGEHDD